MPRPIKLKPSYHRLSVEERFWADVMRRRRRRDQRTRYPRWIVLEAVAKVTGIGTLSILGLARRADTAYARHLAWFMLEELSAMRTSELATWFDRNHATVLAGQRRVMLEMRTRPATFVDTVRVRALVEVWTRDMVTQGEHHGEDLPRGHRGDSEEGAAHAAGPADRAGDDAGLLETVRPLRAEDDAR